MAELWGLRDGLNLCYDMHLSAVDVQLDAKAIVRSEERRVGKECA